MQNAFFVVHYSTAFEKRPDLIGFSVKTDLDGKPLRDKQGKWIAANSTVNKMKFGYKVVYYTPGDYLIKGIFKVEEKLDEDDKRRNREWDPNIQFKIKPVLQPKASVDFRNIIFSGKKTLDMFSHLENVKKQWGMSIGGRNYIKSISPHDLQIFEEAIKEKAPEEATETTPEFATKHLDIQFKLVKIMKSYGYSVHVARNDKAKIIAKGEDLLLNIPDFHNERIVDIASRIDCVAFSEYRVPRILAEVVDTSSTLTESLYRLNEMALTYPRSKEQKFLIIGSEGLRNSFEERMQSSTFKTLNDTGCAFYSYDEIEPMFREAVKTKRKL